MARSETFTTIADLTHVVGGYKPVPPPVYRKATPGSDQASMQNVVLTVPPTLRPYVRGLDSWINAHPMSRYR